MTSAVLTHEQARQRLETAGQSHVLQYWSELNDAQREQLLADIAQVDFNYLRGLVEAYVRKRPPAVVPARIEAAPVMSARPGPRQADLYREALHRGQELIRAGRVAAFTVAGGQGTRLGFDGPKGCFPISPIRHATLFQWFAESLHGTQRRFGRRPPWYIMTSPQNHEATVGYFEANGYFGFAPDEVMFFQQGQMPAFLPDGRLALAEKHRLALSPDGHGGSLRALRESGALDDMRGRGIELVSYFQVDNPLVRCIDPLFVGLHARVGAEMSSKAVTKAEDLERVGNFCLADGKVQVIEYSDLPESLARARDEAGQRLLDAGSIAIHMLSRSFIERLTDPRSAVRLPFHRADKKVPHVDVDDPAGRVIFPDKPNAVKLEMFVFDAIPLASETLVLMTPREEEFSPVKNGEGVDSPATAKRDLVGRAARWLEYCGVPVPRRADGQPDCTLEISPRRALDADDLCTQLDSRPEIALGGTWLLS